MRHFDPSSLKARRAVALAVLSATAGLSAGDAPAADRNWTNGSGGTFTVASNWSGGVVPGATDRAFFSLNDAGYTVTFTASVANDELHVTNDDVTFNLGGTRTYTLNDATFSAVIGSGGGTARFDVESGTLLCTGGMRVADGPGSTGFVTVRNNGVISTAGSLSTSLFVGAGGDGQINLVDVGRLLTTNVVVGVDSGAGGVNVFNDSTWTNSGGIFIATQPLGASSSGRGSILVSGGTLNTAMLSVGDFQGAGTLDLNAPSHVTVTNLHIGRLGTGTVSSTSTLITTNTSIGRDDGGAGTLHVGSASVSGTWTNSGTLTIGGRGRGTLTMNGIGVVATSGGVVTLGESESGRGFARIDDEDVDWTTGTMIVGGRGTGTLEVANGAQVDVNGQFIIGQSDFLAAGTVRVDGSSSALRATGSASLGGTGGGSASVSVTSGALLATGTASIGSGDGGAATVVLSGAGSEWQVNGPLRVGPSGSGTLLINPGTRVTATGSLSVGTNGFVRLDGGTLSVGSLGSNSGVFQFEAGHLRVENAATIGILTNVLGQSFVADAARSLQCVGTLTVGAFGILGVSGGQVSAPNLVNQGVIDFTGSPVPLASTIHNTGLVRGDGRISGSMINLSGGRVRVNAAQSLEMSSSFTNQPGGRAELFGGELSAGSFTNSGAVTLDDGVLTARASITNDVAGVISGRGSIHTGTAGLDNFGSINFSAGFTDVTGFDYVNKPTGKTIVTGGSTSTFFLPVTNEPGSELRVSTNSTAVFFGPVTGAGAFTGTGTVVFEGPVSAGMIDRDGTTVVEAAGTLAVQHVRERALVVRGPATIAPNGTVDGTSRVRSLEIAGGRLDLNDNDLVIDYDGASPLQAVRQHVQSGFASGAWTGDGIATSMGNASQLGLGYAEASAIFPTFPATFSGQNVDNTSVLIAFTRFGDANLDGLVNLADFNRLASNFGSTSAVWSQGDFTYDGTVNLADFNRLASNFGLSAAGTEVTPEDWAALASAVPEPGTAQALLALTCAAGSRRRRR